MWGTRGVEMPFNSSERQTAGDLVFIQTTEAVVQLVECANEVSAVVTVVCGWYTSSLLKPEYR